MRRSVRVYKIWCAHAEQCRQKIVAEQAQDVENHVEFRGGHAQKVGGHETIQNRLDAAVDLNALHDLALHGDVLLHHREHGVEALRAVTVGLLLTRVLDAVG